MAKITLSNLGALLRERRGKAGVRAVAQEIGISAATLSRVENGNLPDLETFSKACKWLGVDPGEVLGFEERLRTHEIPVQSSIEAHLRAEKIQSPEAARALAEMILAAQRMILESRA